MKEKNPLLAVPNDEVRPSPEVDAKPKRRRFSAKYKLRILKEADACRAEGQIGAPEIRREPAIKSDIGSVSGVPLGLLAW